MLLFWAEEHEESVYNQYISEVRNFRMCLEAQEEHLIRQIRTPLDRDDLEQSVMRIAEQEVENPALKQYILLYPSFYYIVSN